jgi:hypothetical protein
MSAAMMIAADFCEGVGSASDGGLRARASSSQSHDFSEN